MENDLDFLLRDLAILDAFFAVKPFYLKPVGQNLLVTTGVLLVP